MPLFWPLTFFMVFPLFVEKNVQVLFHFFALAGVKLLYSQDPVLFTLLAFQRR